jgi:hypothetical protein
MIGTHLQRALLYKTKMKHAMLGKQWMIDLLEMRIVRSRNKIRFEIVKWHNIMSISSTTREVSNIKRKGWIIHHISHYKKMLNHTVNHTVEHTVNH